MSPLSTSSVARGPWLCSHLPHGTSCPGHTQTHTLSDRKSLYLYQFHRCLFAFTPIKPFLAAPHHMLPCWTAEMQNYWRQQCRVISSLFLHRGKDHSHHHLLDLPKSLHNAAIFTGETSARRYTHWRARVWIRMSVCRCWFPFAQSHHWEQTEGRFYHITGLRWDWKQSPMQPVVLLKERQNGFCTASYIK